MIGHRGAAGAAPENTLASIRKARELGATWIEFDVKLTKDGHAILFHDDCLERTTDGRGAVAATTLAEIRRLDAGGWFGPAFRGEPVPTLGQALALCVELHLGINVEIKPCAGREVETAQVTVATLLDVWPRDRPAPLVSSFSPACLVCGARPGAGAAARVSGRHPATQMAGADGANTPAPRCTSITAGSFAGQRAALLAAGIPVVLIYGQRRLARTAAPRGWASRRSSPITSTKC